MEDSARLPWFNVGVILILTALALWALAVAAAADEPHPSGQAPAPPAAALPPAVAIPICPGGGCSWSWSSTWSTTSGAPVYPRPPAVYFQAAPAWPGYAYSFHRIRPRWFCHHGGCFLFGP